MPASGACAARDLFMQLALVLLLACAAVALARHRTLKSFAFAAWVFTFVTASMVWPAAFGSWFGWDLKNLIVPLVQIIMFGMGTKLSPADFARVLKMPWPVFVGVGLHYSVMPLTGYALARLFRFPPEIAAGVILIGSVSSGVASNLIAYLAGGSLALAVTVTACSTLVSPLMTPLLMKILAGRLVTIEFMKMVLEILNMVIVPVGAGLIANRILYGKHSWTRSVGALSLLAAFAILLALGTVLLPSAMLVSAAGLQTGTAVGLGLIAVVVLMKLLEKALSQQPGTWIGRALPLVSMAGICLIVAIITARSRERLLSLTS